MRITERKIDDIVVLSLVGRLTINDGVDLLRETVTSVVRQGNPKVVLNMSQVPYIDSPALGELVHCLMLARGAKGAVKLAGVNGRVVNLLTIMKLTAEFDTHDTEQQALASYLATA